MPAEFSNNSTSSQVIAFFIKCMMPIGGTIMYYLAVNPSRTFFLDTIKRVHSTQKGKHVMQFAKVCTQASQNSRESIARCVRHVTSLKIKQKKHSRMLLTEIGSGK